MSRRPPSSRSSTDTSSSGGNTAKYADAPSANWETFSAHDKLEHALTLIQGSAMATAKKQETKAILESVMSTLQDTSPNDPGRQDAPVTVTKADLRDLLAEATQKAAADQAALIKEHHDNLTEQIKYNIRPSFANMASSNTSAPVRLGSHTISAPRQDRAFNITIKLGPHDNELKKSNNPEDHLRRAFQQVYPTTTRPKITSSQRHASGDFRVCFADVQSARAALARQKEWLPILGTGVTCAIPLSHNAVVFHGVPIDFLDNTDHFADEISFRMRNAGVPGDCIKVEPLSTAAWRENQRRTSALVILSNDRAASRLASERRLSFSGAAAEIVPWSPAERLTQCFKCARFGHRAQDCKNQEACFRCAGDHRSPACLDTCHARSDVCHHSHKCVNCNNAHPAWHAECPSRVAAVQELRSRRVQGRPLPTQRRAFADALQRQAPLAARPLPNSPPLRERRLSAPEILLQPPHSSNE